MNIVIIEDEQLAAERLENMLGEIDASITIVAKLTSVAESISWLSENQADLLFMDIQLSDGICFSIFESIQPSIPIIFTTAYDQYAIQAFDLYSIDYLLKPIRTSELEKSINKYKQFKNMLNPDIRHLIKLMEPKQISYKQRFIVQYGERLQSIETQNIAFFYSLEKSTFFTTFQNDTFSIDYSLNKVNELINPNTFFRVNRTLIINIQAIKNMLALSRSRVKIELVPALPKSVNPVVSIERSNSFKKWIDK